MTILGTISLWLTLLLGTWSLVIGLLGIRWKRPELLDSSRRACVALAPLLGIAVLSLAAALARRDLNVVYVSDHISRNLPLGMTLASVTAGWNGFALLVLLVLATFSIPLASRGSGIVPPLAVATTILLGTAILVFVGDPFRRLGVTPVDGAGLDPLLLGPVLLLEKPLAIIGYATLGVALSSIPMRPGRVHRWIGIAWLALAGSLTAGLWQAYRFASPEGGFDWSAPRAVATGVWMVLSLLLVGLGVRRPADIHSGLRSPGPIAILAGVLCLIVGGVSARTSSSREIRVKAGGSVSVSSPLGGSYTLTHMGVSRFQMADRVTAAATLDAVRGERPIGVITSDKRQYFGLLGQPIGGPITGVGIHRGFAEDVRVVFREATSNEEALYRIHVVPFASLIWLGSALLVLGGLLLTLGLGE